MILSLVSSEPVSVELVGNVDSSQGCCLSDQSLVPFGVIALVQCTHVYTHISTNQACM